MLYRLKQKVGEHEQNGRTYKPGDVIDTEKDLCAMFIGKFDLIHDTDVEDSGKKTKPTISTPSDEDKDDKEDLKSESLSEESKYGKDVTENFKKALVIGVLVFEKVKKNGKWYTVIDPDDNSVLNKKNLRKGKVNGFLKSITEED